LERVGRVVVVADALDAAVGGDELRKPVLVKIAEAITVLEVAPEVIGRDIPAQSSVEAVNASPKTATLTTPEEVKQDLRLAVAVEVAHQQGLRLDHAVDGVRDDPSVATRVIARIWLNGFEETPLTVSLNREPRPRLAVVMQIWEVHEHGTRRSATGGHSLRRDLVS